MAMAANERSWSIGLDFGTAFSKAAAMRFAAGRLAAAAPLALGEAAGWHKPFFAPSILFLDGRCVHFGPRALAHFGRAGRPDRDLARSLKMMLGAHSYQETLGYFPRTSVDPDRAFRIRELIVLYLAYLLRLTEIAGAKTIPDAAEREDAAIRFCRPGWLPERGAAAHETMGALFAQAQAINTAIGDRLVSAEGLDYASARAAIDAALSEQAPFARLDGGIYEASAVALCHFHDSAMSDRMVVVDVGAGTTDVAGLVKAHSGGAITVVRNARRTIDVAGDHLDAALLDLLLSRAPNLNTPAERQALWRRLGAEVRELKERLFDQGKLSFEHQGRSISCKAADLERSAGFRSAIAEIANLYEGCMTEIVKEARRSGAKRVSVLLTGGGAHVPSLRQAIQARRHGVSGIALEHIMRTPDWFAAIGGGAALQPLFAQLSPACGAALSTIYAADAAAESAA
jgi:molecular chaperone DnaK (HSP70)